ncbi:hypothetical protein FISHEDRAFT_55100 [Fistulina hepatica ATCC 64428]|uniref:Uncharacterized protein n=1 Tax=Fistulina hepatica ATCC 64428 TaxID=1128425 RepID=A0A0D7ARX3_9AGAR|nr:hypothetical protein FISHEDRAFT_55100 [Fistulina hepatica ATCC 64428]
MRASSTTIKKTAKSTGLRDVSGKSVYDIKKVPLSLRWCDSKILDYEQECDEKKPTKRERIGADYNRDSEVRSDQNLDPTRFLEPAAVASIRPVYDTLTVVDEGPDINLNSYSCLVTSRSFSDCSPGAIPQPLQACDKRAIVHRDSQNRRRYLGRYRIAWDLDLTLNDFPADLPQSVRPASDSMVFLPAYIAVYRLDRLSNRPTKRDGARSWEAQALSCKDSCW